jgi:putative nucleotidyltransferase with HDIG domain
MPTSAQSLARREGGSMSRRPAAVSPERGDGARQPIVPPSKRAVQGAAWPSAAAAQRASAVPATQALAPWSGSSIGVIRYLPVALLVTLSVAIAPALIADALIAPGGPAGTIATLICAVAISLALAAFESTAWKRLPGARGVLFSDLMLWSFARRLWAERRLKEIGAAYAAAHAAGGGGKRVDLLEGLSRLLQMRNPQTYGHCRRVARHAERIARAMRLAPTEIAAVRAAALIHDVGKVYTPPAILQKQGPLTDEEFDVVRRHCVDGAEMLAPVRDRRLAEVVLRHHERIDGSGYPDGLSGEEIPVAARIIAVADTFDAITSHRSYRGARTQREGLAVLRSESGKQLDATAVAAFLDVYAPRRAIASVSFSAAIWARLAPLQLLPRSLFGGAPLAGLVPAVGAAGLLAVAPAARYERSATEREAGAQRLALRAAMPGAFVRAPQNARRPSAVSIGAPGAKRVRAGRPGHAPPLVRSAPVRSAPQSAGPSTGETRGGGGPPAPVAQLPIGPRGPHLPPAPAPIPSLPTPSVTPPSGGGGVTVAPAGTPGVDAGPIQVPSVTVPGVKMPVAGGPAG